MKTQLGRVVFMSLFAILSSGCSNEMKSPLGKRADIQGKVTFNNTPLKGGTIRFIPIDATKGDETIGAIQAGEYKAAVFPGKYKVAIEPMGTNIPPKYLRADSSQLEIEVSSSGKQDADFPLK